jgi:hypothetical protein
MGSTLTSSGSMVTGGEACQVGNGGNGDRHRQLAGSQKERSSVGDVNTSDCPTVRLSDCPMTLRPSDSMHLPPRDWESSWRAPCVEEGRTDGRFYAL